MPLAFNPVFWLIIMHALSNCLSYLISCESLPIKFLGLCKLKRNLSISAISDESLDDVINALADILDTIEKSPLYDEEKFESHVLYKFHEDVPFTITRDDDTWVIRGEQVEKLHKMTRFNTDESVLRFSNKLKRMGIDDKLRELGDQE
jgi:GTP-binding protein